MEPPSPPAKPATPTPTPHSYVGGNPGKIDLYVGKEVVKKNIPMDSAPDALIQLIKVGSEWAHSVGPE